MYLILLRVPKNTPLTSQQCMNERERKRKGVSGRRLEGEGPPENAKPYPGHVPHFHERDVLAGGVFPTGGRALVLGAQVGFPVAELGAIHPHRVVLGLLGPLCQTHPRLGASDELGLVGLP